MSLKFAAQGGKRHLSSDQGFHFLGYLPVSDHLTWLPCGNPVCFSRLGSDLISFRKSLVNLSEFFLLFNAPYVISLLNASLNKPQRPGQLEKNVTHFSVSAFRIRFGKGPCKNGQEIWLYFVLLYLYEIDAPVENWTRSNEIIMTHPYPQTHHPVDNAAYDKQA